MPTHAVSRCQSGERYGTGGADCLLELRRDDNPGHPDECRRSPSVAGKPSQSGTAGQTGIPEQAGIAGRAVAGGIAGAPASAGNPGSGGTVASAGTSGIAGALEKAGVPGTAGSPAGAGGKGGTPAVAGTAGRAGATPSAGTAGSAGTGLGGGSAGKAVTAGTGGEGGTPDCNTPPAPSPLTGWAAVAGTVNGVTLQTTTGGGTATPQVVTTLAALNAAAKGTAPAVIYIKGGIGTRHGHRGVQQDASGHLRCGNPRSRQHERVLQRDFPQS